MGNFLFLRLRNDKSEFQSGTVRKLCNYVAVRFLSKISTKVFSLYWLVQNANLGGEGAGKKKGKKIFMEIGNATWQ